MRRDRNGEIKNSELRIKKGPCLILNSYFLIPVSLTPFPAFGVRRSESVPVALLILRAGTEACIVAGVGRFELALPFEVPALISVAIFPAGRFALRPSAFVSGHVRVRERTVVPVVPSGRPG